jgi:hypothetical protein
MSLMPVMPVEGPVGEARLLTDKKGGGCAAVHVIATPQERTVAQAARTRGKSKWTEETNGQDECPARTDNTGEPQ